MLEFVVGVLVAIASVFLFQRFFAVAKDGGDNRRRDDFNASAVPKQLANAEVQGLELEKKELEEKIQAVEEELNVEREGNAQLLSQVQQLEFDAARCKEQHQKKVEHNLAVFFNETERSREVELLRGEVNRLQVMNQKLQASVAYHQFHEWNLKERNEGLENSLAAHNSHITVTIRKEKGAGVASSPGQQCEEVQSTVAHKEVEVVAPDAAVSQLGGTHLLLLSFNVGNESAKSESWQTRKLNLCNWITDNDPNVVALQNISQLQVEEVLSHLNHKEQLYAWFGLGACYYGTAREEEGFFGDQNFDYKEYDGSFCPIFWRIKDVRVLKQGCFWLSNTPFHHGSKSWDSTVPRNVTYVQLCVGNAKSVWLFNTQLDQSWQARKRSVKLLREMIAELTLKDLKDEEEGKREDEEQQLPSILVGGLNMKPESELFHILCRGGKEQQLNQECNSEDFDNDDYDEELSEMIKFKSTIRGNTFVLNQGNTEPSVQVDYILVSGRVSVNIAKRLEEHKTIPLGHVPLVATLVV